jgi:hypothetical protein
MRKMLYLAALGLVGLLGFTAQPAAAANSQRLCNVDQVAVIESRLHIKCAPNPQQAYTGEIRFYAMGLNEPAAKVDAIISMAIAAKQLRKPMVLWFDMDDYRSVPGCQGTNCRRLNGAALE